MNLLSRAQQEIAEYCGRPGFTKPLRAEWLVGDDEALLTPALRDSVAHLDCTVAKVYSESTHSIFVGYVDRVWHGAGLEPLIYCNRSYHRVGEDDQVSLERLWERIAFGSLS